MAITLVLKPETEAQLIAQATTQGIPVDRYLESLIEQHLIAQTEPEWKAVLAQLGRSPSLATASPLSDEAMSRESIYREREDQQL